MEYMGLRTTLELDTCIVLFGYDKFRPERCIFISKWTGETHTVSVSELITALNIIAQERREHPENFPQDTSRKRRGRPSKRD